MHIHKRSSSRRWKNGTLVDGIDITGGIDITRGIDISDQPTYSPKAYIRIHDPISHKTEKLTTKDILSYFNKTKRKRKGKQSLKKRLSSLHKKLSRRKKTKRK